MIECFDIVDRRPDTYEWNIVNVVGLSRIYPVRNFIAGQRRVDVGTRAFENILKGG